MARLKRQNAACGRDRRGLALIETALVLVLLVMLVMAAIEYGWMFMKQQQVTNAARHAARVAVTADSTTAEVDAVVTALMTSAGMDGSGYTVTYSPTEVGSAERLDDVTVTVTVPYDNSLELINMALLPVPQQLRGKVTMAKEGP